MSHSTNKAARYSNSEMLFAKLGPITYRSPDDLMAYKRNARKHPERQLVALGASMRQFGFNVPVLIDGAGEIIAGHARVQAAQRIGITEIPTICATHMSPAQVKAYRLADNRLPELATYDMGALVIELQEIIALDEIEVESLGWTTAEMDTILVSNEDEGAGIDPADAQIEPPIDPVARPGDLWQLGRHRLVCGSALDPSVWERLLDGEQARMIFSDPPFNVPVSGHVSGLGKVKHAEFAMASGEMTRSEFTGFLDKFLATVLPHACDGAVVDICMDWRHLRELLDALDSNELTLLNMCCWNKSNGGLGSLYRSKYELVLIAKKGSAVHINNVELGKHGRYRTNVWDYAGVNGFSSSRMKDLADHPTVKPIALVADAIRDVTNMGDIVLDGFMGSGTTILAAERTGRRGYGAEIELKYIDVAIRRWQEMTGRDAVLAGDGRTWGQIADERRALAEAGSGNLDEQEARDVAA